MTDGSLELVVLEEDDKDLGSSFAPTLPRLQTAGVVVLVSYGTLSKKAEVQRLSELLRSSNITHFERIVVDECSVIGERSEKTNAFKFINKYDDSFDCIGIVGGLFIYISRNLQVRYIRYKALASFWDACERLH